MNSNTIEVKDQIIIEKYHDNYWRTLAKVISMRVTFTGVHIFNTWLVTGSLAAGLTVAGLAFVIMPALYWFHERAWNYTNWGRLADLKRKFQENNWRSLGKDVTWRFVAILGNFLIAFIAGLPSLLYVALPLEFSTGTYLTTDSEVTVAFWRVASLE